MSRITAIDPTSSSGHVRELLDGVQKGLGATPNLFRTAARSPATLEGMVALFGAAGKGKLGARYQEAIALTVSELNRCDYCLSAHSVLGKRAGLDDEALARAREGTAKEPRLAAAVRFARAVAEKRGRVTDEDVAEVRKAGLGDDEILEVITNVALTTFTNYLNEVAATEIDFPVVHHHPR